MTVTPKDKNKSAYKLNGFGPVYYLNLDGQPERKEYMESQFDYWDCLLYTSPSPRDATLSRMPSSA